tara:strand:+ start:131 stop:418 length:288 start_codon:yes stop_codon:yes gene_type:complete
MAYDSLTSQDQNLKAKLEGVDRLSKQIKVLSQTLGNLDERISALEGFLNSALLKQQEDIKAAWTEINALSGAKDAADKFDMDATTAPHPDAPPVG